MTVLAEIPYGAYWSTPFVKWQGSLQHLHSLRFAAWVAKRELHRRDIDTDSIAAGVLGVTIPQQYSFYGAPWVLALAGLPRVTGPSIAQACATGVRCVLASVQEIQSGTADSVLSITADRCSNGPHIYYPAPSAPGGTGATENWVLDNFSCDPLGRHAMIETAENVAARHGIETDGQLVIAVFDGTVTAPIDKAIEITLPLADLHLFDNDSGDALHHGLTTAKAAA